MKECLASLTRSVLLTSLIPFTAIFSSEPRSEGDTSPGGFRVPPGCKVELVADASIVQHPLFACFDDRGRLYVAEGTGKNLPGEEIEPLKLAKISLLEDSNGDGKFDKRKVFADGLVFAAGVQWHGGSVYVASYPSIWKLTDSDGDDVADHREEVVGKFDFIGNGEDVHGPFVFPDGWLYWTHSRRGYRVKTREGKSIEGLAARVWRCRMDGTGVERIAGGGFDNAVELAFTETADLCGTMDQYPGDMLLQYVEGGVYPRADHSSIAEFPRTGDLLTPIAGFSAAYPAALCGLERLRTDHFGPGHRGALLTTQFNVRRVQKHILKHEGARLLSNNEDFLVSTDWDFHPTDVLEDADGSLLVIDMGSWFNYFCPTQKIAKEQVTGVIYRLRRLNAPKDEDPWGKKIAWSTLSAEKLAETLTDVRHRVALRAIEELVKRGESSIRELSRLVNEGASVGPTPQREAVYALSRIGTTEARVAVRAALSHRDATVREVAVHCVSVERDAQALPRLCQLVVNDTDPIRRKAAEALGRIGNAAAVEPLFDSIRKGSGDLFLQHSLIYALIQIGAFEATAPALRDSNPGVRRAALIALDQMNGTELQVPNPSGAEPHPNHPYRGSMFRYIGNAELTREHIAPLIATTDPVLRQAVLEIVSRRPAWSQELIAVAERIALETNLSAGHREALVAALEEASGNAKVQQFIAASLIDEKVPESTRRDLFGVLARSHVQPMPSAWLDALEKVLRDDDASMQREALNVVRIRHATQLDNLLAELGNSSDTPDDVRLVATAIVAPRTALNAEAFERLTDQLKNSNDPLSPVAAATALGSAKLTAAQRQTLMTVIAKSGPLTLPLLVKAFHNTRDTATSLALAKALSGSPGSRALPADELELIFGKDSLQRDGELATAMKPLIEQRQQTLAQQAKYIGELGEKMSANAADIRRGEAVFFSKEAKCSACHLVNGRGAKLGPDLSRIGSIRTTMALLESVVFPSNSIVPDFRSYVIELQDGRLASGRIERETKDSIFLRTSTLEEIRVSRSEIANIAASDVSFMPQGLEKTMTPQQLNDLLEYLYSLK